MEEETERLKQALSTLAQSGASAGIEIYGCPNQNLSLSENAMSEPNMGDLFAALKMPAMEPLGDGAFRLIGTAPDWLPRLYKKLF